MSTVKTHLRRLLKTLPHDCTIADAMYELYVIWKVERGLAALDRGEVVPHEQVVKEFEAWLREPGLPRRRRKAKRR